MKLLTMMKIINLMLMDIVKNSYTVRVVVVVVVVAVVAAAVVVVVAVAVVDKK